jgi:hypothetical protein
MGDEPYTTQRTTSSQSSRRSTSPHQAAYAAERAKLLFGSYRRGDANDPDTYVAAITAVLCRYDTDLIREVTDPNLGIATSDKFSAFMPNAGELKIYCEGIAARRARLERLGSLRVPDINQARLNAPDPLPGRLANVHVPADHPRYARLVEWAKTVDDRWWKFGKSSEGRAGLWVPLNIWQDGQDAMNKIATVQTMTPEQLREHYAKHTLARMPKARDTSNAEDAA